MTPPATIELIAHAAATNNGSFAGSQTTSPVDTTGANFIVVATQANTPTVTDSNGNTWVLVNNFTRTGNNGLFYVTASTATTLTVANPFAVGETHSAIVTGMGAPFVSPQGQELVLVTVPNPNAGEQFFPSFLSPYLQFGNAGNPEMVSALCGSLLSVVSVMPTSVFSPLTGFGFAGTNRRQYVNQLVPPIVKPDIEPRRWRWNVRRHARLLRHHRDLDRRSCSIQRQRQRLIGIAAFSRRFNWGTLEINSIDKGRLCARLG